MVMEFITMLMVIHMKGILMKAKCMDGVTINLRMGMNTMGNGRMIKWKEKESILQQQVIVTRDILLMEG